MTTLSEEETRELAWELVHKYDHLLGEGCLVIGLTGELGAGKTVFTKGIAEALKLTEPISSPSYVYIHEHKHARGKLVHIDLWRIERELDFRELNLGQYIRPGNVVVVEWPKEFLAEELSRVESKSDFKIGLVEVTIKVEETLRKIEINPALSASEE